MGNHQTEPRLRASPPWRVTCELFQAHPTAVPLPHFDPHLHYLLQAKVMILY